MPHDLASKETCGFGVGVAAELGMGSGVGGCLGDRK